MTNNEIVTQNLELIQTCVSHQMRKYDCPQEFYDDIVQDMCILLLEYDNGKLSQIVADGHLNAFLSACLVRQIYSKNSQTYRTYRRLRENSDPVTEDVVPALSKAGKKEPAAESLPYYPEDYMPCDTDSDEAAALKKAVQSLSPGERNIFLTYCETPNITKLSRTLKCPSALLTNYINNVKNKLKSQYEYITT